MVKKLLFGILFSQWSCKKSLPDIRYFRLNFVVCKSCKLLLQTATDILFSSISLSFKVVGVSLHFPFITPVHL